MRVNLILCSELDIPCRLCPSPIRTLRVSRHPLRPCPSSGFGQSIVSRLRPRSHNLFPGWRPTRNRMNCHRELCPHCTWHQSGANNNSHFILLKNHTLLPNKNVAALILKCLLAAVIGLLLGTLFLLFFCCPLKGCQNIHVRPAKLLHDHSHMASSGGLSGAISTQMGIYESTNTRAWR